MAEIINITSLDPNTFEFQDYSISDSSLITSFETETSFNSQKDIIEYFIYDINNNILYENTFGFPRYKLINNLVSIDPEGDLKSLGYDEGQYNTLYNFVSPKLASNVSSRYFISQISSDRTEIRLDTTSIPNELVISSSLELVNNINNSTGSYYDFYLDFGNNQLVIANNAQLDNSNVNNPTILIKLYEALPLEFTLKSELWVVTKIANSVAYNINITQTFNIEDEFIYLKGPNTNINVQNQINNSTNYSNLSQLSTTDSIQGSGSLRYQLNNLLAKRGIDINIDYSDYSNFIHFSSAQTRLENFYYKLSLIEQYNYSASLSNNTPTNYYVSSSNILYQTKIDEIITGFDNYEYYLYYDSSSAAWPKTNSTPPYVNVLTSSPTGMAWFATQSIIAEDYDVENNNALTNAIPGYILDDSANAQYDLFVEMVGQYFDTVFLYTQDITNKYNADNRVNYGVSKDLVADILRDLGVKIYQNNFSTNDLYSALLGLTPSGSLYNLPFTTGSLPTPTGFEYINTYVTASSTSSLIPTEDLNAEIYKRIYANLPYLLKKKGSVEGLRALLTIYGIPDTILRVNEFGGKDKNPNTWDYWQNEYNYAFSTSGSAFISSSFVLNSSWDSLNDRPQAVEFRFKTDTLPQNTASVASQSLWSTNNGVTLRLRYTGSGYTTASYSGGPINPYYQYALLEFIPNTSSISVSASIYLPFYNGEWWSVLVNSGSNGFTLYAADKNYNGEDGNVIGFQASSSITGSNVWNTSLISTFGSSSNKIFTGSFQEIRYYTQPLTNNNFNDYVMNPNSIESSEYLAFRATLGGELYTSSISVHPKVTGSWIPTSSFTSNSIFHTSSGGKYVPNTEIHYYDQVPAGIQNPVSQKIKQQNIVLPYSSSNVNVPNSDVLSPFISVQQFPSISQSYTRDIDYVEVAFSPQNEINDDINDELGYFNVGELIGDPRFQSSSLEYYPDLNALSNSYFKKYDSNYDWNDYVRLIKFFDNSLFKMLADWIPARASLASGVVIKNTLLDRNRYRTPQVTTSSSLANIGSGSTNIPYIIEDQTITGSIDVGNIEGGNGGSMPDLLGLTSSLFTYPGAVNITQVWEGSTPSLSGSVSFTESSQTEFYDGELSGSNLVVTNGDLNDCEVELLELYSNSSLGTVIATVTTGYNGPTLKIPYDVNNDNVYYLSFSYNNLDLGSNISVVDNTGRIFLNIVGGLSNTPAGTIEKIQINNPDFPLGFQSTDFGGCPITNLSLYESYIEPDCLVIENDVQVSRPSSKYLDVDFTDNYITAVNEQAVLSGSATKATVPDSNYTSLKSANPRYFGCQNDEIDEYAKYFAYFDWIGGSTYIGGGNIHIINLVDVEGNVITLTPENRNLFNVEQIFKQGDPVYAYQVNNTSVTPFSLPTMEIIEGGALYQTILVKSGSGDINNAGLTIEADVTYNFPDIYFISGSNPPTTSSLLLNNPISPNPNFLDFLITGSNFSNVTSYTTTGTSGVIQIYNKLANSLITGTVNVEDTLLPIQYSDFIRFGNSSITGAGSLDYSWDNGFLYQIITTTPSNLIPIIPDLGLSSSLQVTPAAYGYPQFGNLLTMASASFNVNNTWLQSQTVGSSSFNLNGIIINYTGSSQPNTPTQINIINTQLNSTAAANVTANTINFSSSIAPYNSYLQYIDADNFSSATLTLTTPLPLGTPYPASILNSYYVTSGSINTRFGGATNESFQAFRIIRRIPNETFVIISDLPTYRGQGLLIPYNFDPKYNPSEIAKRVGLIQ